MTVKPPYQIPSIHKINQRPWNGLRVAELFAGGGGSDIGWRWAGYRTIWANEFMPYAADCYQANHPRTKLDRRDIKLVQPEDIGEVDILSGSPPCQGFSIANQNRLKRKAKTYENGISQVNEDLFFEYIRILRGLKPKVFVAENVRGLTIGGGKKVFGSFEMDMFINQDDTILHALMDSGYVVRWQILNAADYGTPQSRPRVFIIGVRKDLKLEPVFPVRLGYQYSVLDALPHLAGDDIHWSNVAGHGTNPIINGNNPAPCVTRRGHKDSGCKTFIKAGQYGDHRRRESGYDLKEPIASIKAGGGTHGHQFKIGYGMGYENKSQHSFRRNVTKSVNEPMDTIAKMPGCAGGSNATVTDGETTRKFTIAELKRLGGFPDDYDLTPAKSYSRQWEIIGNSVAPPQLYHIGLCLYHQIFKKL